MRKILIPVALCFFLVACVSGSADEINAKTADSVAGKSPVLTDSLPQTVSEEGEDEGCVFDTSSHKFTTQALKKFDANIRYTWDSSGNQYVAVFNDNDSLGLYIGGCTHFGYSAYYYTDSSRYEDEAFIADKVKWMAKNFFDNDFDKVYVNAVSKGLYKKEDGVEAGTKGYEIKISDTSITDHVYDGWLVEKIGARTKISLLGYIN